MLVLEGLVGLHRTIQLKLLQHYWLGHRLGLLWYWPGADSGSDHELLIAKFRLKLKKVEKTTRPFRYDLNQILYNYTVEVRNRFKGLDLIDRVPDELWTEEPGGLQSMGSLRVGHDWATSLSLFTFMHWRGKWQPTPAFLTGESQGGGAWWAAIYGVAQSRTRLKQLSSSSSSSSSRVMKDVCF